MDHITLIEAQVAVIAVEAESARRIDEIQIGLRVGGAVTGVSGKTGIAIRGAWHTGHTESRVQIGFSDQAGIAVLQSKDGAHRGQIVNLHRHIKHVELERISRAGRDGSHHDKPREP